MRPRHLLTVPNFLPNARALRRVFEEKFENPRDTRNDRFVWDYWHIEDQYTLLRTPARAYFPNALFREAERRLLAFAKERLGCSGLSEPWLSCYVEGCEQKLHADNPHGPWAFVYSLTPWNTRRFKGGETVIAKPKLLEYWRDFSSERGSEYEDLFTEVPARFNQLTVFDPRLPHGVKRLSGGVHSPAEGRLVLHGWFTEPRPFIDGALSKGKASAQAARILDESLGNLSRELSSLSELHGTLTIELKVAGSGSVTNGKILTHTLISREDTHDSRPARAAIATIFRGMGALRFPRAGSASRITVPFLFR